MHDPHELELASANTLSIIAGRLLPPDTPDEDVEVLESGCYEVVAPRVDPEPRSAPPPLPRAGIIPLSPRRSP